MRPVFGDILINFGVVWYSGTRKWYAGFSVVVEAVGVVPGAKPCKSAGNTRVYPGFSRHTRKIPGIFADFADFATKKETLTALLYSPTAAAAATSSLPAVFADDIVFALRKSLRRALLPLSSYSRHDLRLEDRTRRRTRLCLVT